MVSSGAVSARRLAIPLAVVAALVATGSAAQHREPEEPPTLVYTGEVPVNLAGRRLLLPMALTPDGPLFALPPLVERLGGELERGPRGQGYTLRLAGGEFLFGPESDKVVVDRQIIALSQRPLQREAGIMVPLDLLERTFGDLLGYSFDWDSFLRRLDVDRLRARELALWVDTVHIRGTTTVVLQFPEAAPRYRIVEGDRLVDVELLGDRLATPLPSPRIEGPLVEGVRVSPERVRIELAPGAQATSYVLKRPFRIVFDIHRDGGDATTTPLVPPSPRYGVRTIVIDPGHGGSEVGAVGSNGAVEKELTLALAQALARRLEQRLPVRVVLTREEDANLPLETRTAIANQNKGDLFISLHLNSALGRKAAGAETYFLSLQASDSQAAAVAEVENKVDAGDGGEAAAGDPLFDLQLILWDLAQSQYLAESQRLGNLIQEELNSTLGLRDRGVKQAPFKVLMGAAMPAVLVELGFLSNPEEERKLLNPARRAELVDAVVRAVSRYRAQIESGGTAEGREALP